MKSPEEKRKIGQILHRPAPPDEVWAAIESSINKPESFLSLVVQKYKPWLLATTAAASLLVAIGMVTWKLSIQSDQPLGHQAHSGDPAEIMLTKISMNEDRPDLVLYAAVIREKLNQLNNAIDEYEALIPVNNMNGRITLYLEQVLEERQQTIEELKQTIRETTNENPG